MADHGRVEYATATGNDLPAHESTYKNFILIAFVSSALVISITILHRYTIRRGLLTARLLRRVTLAAVTFGLVLLLLETAHIWMVNAEPLLDSQKSVPLRQLFLDIIPGFVATLAFCLLPFSTVPLTLHWARHR